MGSSSPSSLVTNAAVVRLEIYGAEAHCFGAVIAAGSGPADEVRTFRRGEPITMDVPPGKHALALVTYADENATDPIGWACTETTLAPGSQICFDLTLASSMSAADGGPGDAGGDLACSDDTSSSVTNCGGCGMPCSTNHMVPTCSAGQCGGACMPGYGDCNLDPRSDGCEAELNSVTNCGACGALCSIGNDNSGRACNGTACSYTCVAGRFDCNPTTGHDTDGCECAGSGCCNGTKAAATGGCQTHHDDGVGDSFYDCLPLNTYTQNEAMAACTAYAVAHGKTAAACTAYSCGNDSFNSLVCSDAQGTSMSFPCECWGFGMSGGVGHVNGGCFCPDTSDPAWH